MEIRDFAMLALSVDFDKKYKSFCGKRKPPTKSPSLPISTLTSLIEAKGKLPIRFRKEDVVKFHDLVKVGLSCVSSYGTDVAFFENRFRAGQLGTHICIGFELIGPVRRDYSGGGVGMIANYAHALRNGREEITKADRTLSSLYFSNEKELHEVFEFVFDLYGEIKPLVMKSLEDELVRRNKSSAP